jgi:putative lipoprotein
LRYLIRLIGAILAVATTMSAVQAETGELRLSVTYRERIAMPPDAQLEVQLLDVSRDDAAATRIASQRFAMTGVPMAVVLPYDPAVVDDAAVHAVVAEIRSGDRLLFRATQRDPVLAGPEAVMELVLSMVAEDGAASAPVLSISGVEWAVTEIAGEPWGNDDPATLVVDEDMSFGLFGGCNRFGGTLTLYGSGIAFPQDFAGTLMACPSEVEALERRFLDALRGVSRYVRYGTGLVLTDADGRALLHFAQRPE